MNLSAVLIHVQPDQMETAVADLNSVPEAEVYHLDHVTGRIVAVLEAASVDREVAALRRIQALSCVLSAELVYHYFAEDESGAAFACIDGAQGDECADPILQRLNDHGPP